MGGKNSGRRKPGAPEIKEYIEPPDIGELKKQADAEPVQQESAIDPRLSVEHLTQTSEHTGNGRPRGIVAMVKALSGNGWDVLSFWNDVFRGNVEGFSGRERLEASKLLFERGFGKPIDTTVLIDATKAEQEAELRTVPTELLYDVLSRLAPPANAAVARLEKNELIAMPDVVQGAALGRVVDAEYVPVPDDSPDSEKDYANKQIMRAKLDQRALVDAGLMKKPEVNKSRVIVKQKTGSKVRTSNVYVKQPEEPEDDEP